MKNKLIHILLHESNSYSSAVKRWNIMREIKKYHQIFVCYYYDFVVVVVKILVGAWSSFMCIKTPLTNVWHTFYILKYHIHCVYVFFWSLWSFSIPLHFVAHAYLYDTLISIASRFFFWLSKWKEKKTYRAPFLDTIYTCIQYIHCPAYTCTGQVNLVFMQKIVADEINCLNVEK